MSEYKKYYKQNYIVYKNGNVWSIKRNRLLSMKPNKLGYVMLYLANNERIYHHRLIAEMFIPNPNKYKYVNHKDGNKSNNHVDNLEWCSHKQNIQHAWNNGLIKPVYREDRKHKLKNKHVEMISILKLHGINQCDIAEVFGVSQCLISKI